MPAAAPRDMPQEGIELIKSFEGIPDGDPSTVNIDAYLDPVGIWTIGWGHAITVNGGFLRGAENKAQARAMYPGGITRAQAELLLRGDLVDSAAAVSRLATVPLSDGQYGALVSFAFNAGAGNLAASTLLKRLNGGDYAGAADQFMAWNKSRKNGVLVELPGLTRRRRTERALFLGQDWRAAAAAAVTRERVVYAIEPEPAMQDAFSEAPPRPARTAARQQVAQTAAKKRAAKTAAGTAARTAAKTRAKTGAKTAGKTLAAKTAAPKTVPRTGTAATSRGSRQPQQRA